MKEELKKEWFEKFGLKIIPKNEEDVKQAEFLEKYWDNLFELMFDWWHDKIVDISMEEGLKRYNQAKEDGTLDKHFPTL